MWESNYTSLQLTKDFCTGNPFSKMFWLELFKY